jgi:hypothetical protein
MYYKEIESDKAVAKQHSLNQKRNASQRLAEIAAKRKKNKLHGG